MTFVAGLVGLVAVAGAQTSEVNPEIYDLSTANADFAARGSLEFDPPTRSNVLIVGDGLLLAGEPVRPTNPWASVLGQPQAFELNYNVDTGDLSWSLLGATLNTSYFLQPGYGLAYIQPSVKVQTPAGAMNNMMAMSDLQVSVNGAAPISHSPLSISGNGFASNVIYFTDYNVHTVKVTGTMTVNVPEAWSDDINGTYADVEFLSAQPVPEPATMAILGVGALTLLRRKRKNA